MFKMGNYIRIIFIFLVVTGALFLIVRSCETPASITKKRIKSVENGLIKEILIEGQKVKKMKLSERMPYYMVPGVSIAVIDKFQVEWAKGYGVKEKGGSDPVTNETLFQAGDISQPVAALASLIFVEKGLLDFDSDVNKFLASWKIPENKFTRENKVTLRKLLNHSAGLAPVDFKGYAEGESLPSLVQVLNGEKPANSPAVSVGFAPGSQQQYSESGYVVLQQLLVDLGGRPFPAIIEESVLRPLEMAHSSYEYPLPSALMEKASTGHSQDGEPVKGKWSIYPEAAASGLWSTPSDLALFSLEVTKTGRGESQKVISPRLAREMMTPQFINKGLGVLVDDKDDDINFNLRGRSKGFEAYMIVYPAKGQGAVIMTNSDNGSFLINEILRGISITYKWPHFKPLVKALFKLSPSVYQQYVGKYEVRPDYVLNVTHEDYYLVIQPTGQAPTRFYVETETSFFSADPYVNIHFIIEKGVVTGLVLTQKGQRLEAKKIG